MGLEGILEPTHVCSAGGMKFPSSSNCVFAFVVMGRAKHMAIAAAAATFATAFLFVFAEIELCHPKAESEQESSTKTNKNSDWFIPRTLK